MTYTKRYLSTERPTTCGHNHRTPEAAANCRYNLGGHEHYSQVERSDGETMVHWCDREWHTTTEINDIYYSATA